MPKSKYPQQLDTSVELPPVRDNILEIGSDVINSLRSAIFQIERTLGINPQGAVGNTLASRIDNALDGNGNILQAALSRSNVLSGPILDANVSSVAAIQESKLKLNFPTTLLQDEISIINSLIDNIVDQIEEINATLSAHISTSAANRHRATSISVASATASSTDTAATNLTSGTLQAALETIYNAHIHYSGTSISSTNNSHTASQVYFDDSDVSSIISADDVQEAIEDLALASQNTEITHQDLFHSNGLLKNNKLDSSTTLNVGEVLASDITLTFSSSAGQASGITTVTLGSSVLLGDFDLRKSDILTITDISDTSGLYTGSYEIESFTQSGAGVLLTINIYGNLLGSSTSNTRGRISKNLNLGINTAALAVSVREEASATAARTLQIANPNAVRVISTNITPSAITTSNRYIGLSIDGSTDLNIDLYDGTVTRQSVDSIVLRINEQCAENAWDFLAYKLNLENGKTELALVYNLPDEGTAQHTFTVSRSSDDGIDAAGFSDIEDEEISALYGTAYYLNGVPYEGLVEKIDSTALSFNSGTTTINNGSSTLNFLNAGIRAQDLLVISGSTSTADDGTYVISSVSSTQIALSSDQLPTGFASSSDSGTRFRIYENTVSLNSLTFEAVGGTFGSALLDVFMDSNRHLNYNKRFEYTTKIFSSSSVITLVDFEGEVTNEELTLTVEDGTEVITMTLDSGKSVEVRGNDSYVWLTSGAYNIKLKFYIPSVDTVISTILSEGSDITLTFYGFESINTSSNVILDRVAYDNFNGRAHLPGAISSTRVGLIGMDVLGQDVQRTLQETPFNELRSNGVVYGLEVSTATVNASNFYVFNVSRGVTYVGGKRFELDAVSQIVTDIDATVNDKIFIVIDEYGNVKYEAAVSTCISPFCDSEHTLLSTLEYDGSSVSIIDLRLFIDELDLKILNEITVSPQSGMAHFDDLGKALKYAKRFTQIFTDAGTPTVHLKAGTYQMILPTVENTYTFANWIINLQHLDSTVLTAENDKFIDAGLALDFPVNITGEGDSTVLDIRNRYTFVGNQVVDFVGFFLIPGDGFTLYSSNIDKFTDGFIRIKNLKLQNTAIKLEDFNITDGTNPYLIGVDIQDVIFDFSTFVVNSRELQAVAISFGEESDTTNDKGNLVVDRCKFIDSQVDPGSAASNGRLKNLVFSNNFVMNDDSLEMFIVDLYSFSNVDNGSNITLIGNHNTTNFYTVGNASEADIGGTGLGWGDRLSRSLRVGGNIDLGGDLTVGDDVTADNYAYNSTKTKTRIYTISDTNADASAVAFPWATATSSATYTVSTLTSADVSLRWPAAALAISQQFRIRIDDLDPGETIVGVRIGVEPDTTDTITWTTLIQTGEITGADGSTNMFTLQEAGTRSPIHGSTNIDTVTMISNTSGTTTFATTGQNSVLWFVNVYHNTATTYNLYWIELTIETDDVESSLGLS